MRKPNLPRKELSNILWKISYNAAGMMDDLEYMKHRPPVVVVKYLRDTLPELRTRYAAIHMILDRWEEGQKAGRRSVLVSEEIQKINEVVIHNIMPGIADSFFKADPILRALKQKEG